MLATLALEQDPSRDGDGRNRNWSSNPFGAIFHPLLRILSHFVSLSRDDQNLYIIALSWQNHLTVRPLSAVLPSPALLSFSISWRLDLVHAAHRYRPVYNCPGLSLSVPGAALIISLQLLHGRH